MSGDPMIFESRYVYFVLCLFMSPLCFIYCCNCFMFFQLRGLPPSESSHMLRGLSLPGFPTYPWGFAARQIPLHLGEPPSAPWEIPPPNPWLPSPPFPDACSPLSPRSAPPLYPCPLFSTHPHTVFPCSSVPALPSPLEPLYIEPYI